MNPFDENDLVAFHLQELPPRRRRALERALRTDPVLARDSAEIAALLLAFRGHISTDLDRNLVERNWSALETTIMNTPPVPAPRFQWSWHKPTMLAGGLALASLAVVVAVNHHAGTTRPQTEPRRAADADRTSTTHPPQQENMRPIPATDTPANRGDKDIIRRTIRPSPQQLFAKSSLDAPAHAVIVSQTSPPAPSLQQTATPPQSTASPLGATPPIATQTAALATGTASLLPANGSRRQASAARRRSSTDVTLAMGGTFIPTRDGAKVNNTQMAEGASHAVSAIASFHQQFRPGVGYRVTASYTRPDFHFLNSTYGEQEINGRIFELAGTYVIQGPHHGRITTALDAGVGVMGILATIDSSATSSNIRVSGIAGFSTEVALTRHLAVHAAYRAQLFEGPDFRAVKAVYPLAVSNMVVSHEPSLGITYRFSRKQQ